jgi:hypothetical protein
MLRKRRRVVRDWNDPGPAQASPGGWGAEESEPASDRTLGREILMAIHLDLGEAEFWQQYESANECVIATAPCCLAVETPPCPAVRRRVNPPLPVAGDGDLRPDQFRIMTLL